jgi:undecaprenyl-diphosphatase
LLTAVVASYLLVARKASTALFVIGATIGGAMLSTTLKSFFQRPRPDLVAHLVDVTSTSFPSGHAMNSAVVYLTLGALLARTQKDRRTRIFILSVAIALTLIIGTSRVYLGVHWPSDVLAGWAVGATWAALCSTLARMLQRRGAIDSATGAPTAAS